MASTKAVDGAAEGSVGVGELQMSRAAMFLRPPNPNRALDQWVKKNTLTGGTSFDAVSWLDVAKANVSWDSVSWDSVSWADAAWNVVSWADVSWADVSWADVSWADVSWADVSWADSSYEDAAEGDTTGDPNGYELTPEQAAEIMADPETAPDPSACRPRSPRQSRDDTGATGAPAHGRRAPEPARRRTGHSKARAGSNPGPPSFGGYSGRTEKGGCDPRSRRRSFRKW